MNAAILVIALALWLAVAAIVLALAFVAARTDERCGCDPDCRDTRC